MKNTNIEFHFANPVMPVRDVREAANYYKHILGFNIDVIWEKPNYACVSRGGISIELGENRPNHIGSGACVVDVSNIDELYQEFVDQGATLEGDFAERDYGSKDFRIRDHDGNLLVFGSALPNKAKLIEKRNVA